MEANESQGFRWQVPTRPPYVIDKHQLKILNSYTKKKELFVPNKTKTIKWYSCGPTVYDVAHLGHARCYITFDIVRRILTDYFGYHVFYVMNITDIDDKIIKRARSDYLCDIFLKEESPKLSQHELVQYLRDALSCYQKKRKDEKDPAKLEMISKTISNSTQAINKVELFTADDYKNMDKLFQTLSGVKDVIADYQDDKLAHTVVDLEIFKQLTLKYEKEFHSDMHKLNVLQPSALTRVSEFIEEVGAFIKKLESNGYAYRSNGSVYFDTLKFDENPKHSYAKLVREAYGHKKTNDDGEGELSTASQDQKKSPSDFALWKRSKIGEPFWTTQDLEPGRPGWHIECSVMASLMLGENFDLHSGGCDLKFPHHDNEIAQAEAYYDSGRNWVNYFVHSGHLTIAGCKMSKSLKNFITIRQALTEYTARQLRFAFLAHSWAETLDYSPNTMKTAITYEKTFKEFLLNVADYSRQLLSKPTDRLGGAGSESCEIYRKWSKEDEELNEKFLHAIDKVDIALCDNLNTRAALNALTALIKESNKRNNSDLVLIRDIAEYVMRILSIFGVAFDEIKFKPLYQDSDNVESSEDVTETTLKYVDALARFRADVRRISKSGLTSGTQQGFKDILALCDTLRDKTLPSLGVKLEDKEVQGVPYVVKLIDPK